jgi:hypothetical protein
MAAVFTSGAVGGALSLSFLQEITRTPITARVARIFFMIYLNFVLVNHLFKMMRVACENIFDV